MTLKTRLFLILLMVVAVLPFAPAIAQSEVDSVCLVTDIGRINDGTFNQTTYEGMMQAAEDYELDTTFIETQAQTDYESNINNCLQEDYDIIITVGFLLTDATVAAANEHPDKFFIGIDQDARGVAEPPSNWVGIQAREDQAGFIVGALAALVTEANIIGAVYGPDIPPIVRFRNGYDQGIRYINPEIEILSVYIDDFQAPDRGGSAAVQFVGEGADVLFGGGGPTGSGAILAAAQEGIYVIGVDQDEYFTTFGAGETPGAEFLISSALKRVDVGVYDMIAAIMEGEGFLGGDNYILTVENGGIDFAGPNDSDIPEEIYAQVTEIRDMLAAGEIETGVDPVSGELLEGGAEATPEATETSGG